MTVRYSELRSAQFLGAPVLYINGPSTLYYMPYFLNQAVA